MLTKEQWDSLMTLNEEKLKRGERMIRLVPKDGKMESSEKKICDEKKENEKNEEEIMLNMEESEDEVDEDKEKSSSCIGEEDKTRNDEKNISEAQQQQSKPEIIENKIITKNYFEKVMRNISKGKINKETMRDSDRITKLETKLADLKNTMAKFCNATKESIDKLSEYINSDKRETTQGVQQLRSIEVD